jgi:dTMP kinase
MRTHTCSKAAHSVSGFRWANCSVLKFSMSPFSTFPRFVKIIRFRSMRGAFIVLEGLDRSGKSTQASLLCDSLKAQGRKVLLWKYPARETFLGKTIDGYLKNAISLPDETIHLLFSANRWETVDYLLNELKNGTDVVCDRYAYSGIAYSAAKGLDFEWCRNPDRGLPQPDLVLYMNVSASVARLRGGYGEERYEKEEFQAKVGAQFMRLAGSEGERWRVINADRAQTVISDEILSLCSNIPSRNLEFMPGKLWIPGLSPERVDRTDSPQVEGPLDSKLPSKKEDKRQAKEAAKREKEDERLQLLLQQQKEAEGPKLTLHTMDSSLFGSIFIQSDGETGRKFTPVRDLGSSRAGSKVWLRARAQTIRKQGGKLTFIVLRDDLETVQAVVASTPEMAKFAGSLSKESVVDVFGTVTVPPEPLRACSQSHVELAVERIYCLSRAEVLPLQLEDLSRSETELAADPKAIRVLLETRLSNRVIDLRTRANQGILRLQSGVCQLFKEYLLERRFVEIHTPKLLATASEGGSSVFQLKYFDRFAYLAQSPQFYKQMALMADLPGVFEIGPVFRSENSFTHRHMTEFVGLDLEMPFREHYSEVLDVMDGLFNHLFTGLQTRFKSEIEAVREQYPFEDLKWKNPCLRLEYKDAIKLLVTHGPGIIKSDIGSTDAELASLPQTPENEEQRKKLEKRKEELTAHLEDIKTHNENQDMGTSDEKVLGRVIRAIHDTDFYMITRFPVEVRPFYTMPCPDDPRWTNSYDIFLRGEEIVSGAQRIHDPALLLEVAKSKGVDLAPVQSYVDAFKYGAFPHGGGGVGLERVVMLFLGLPNIRLTSMFPRDPNRLTP